MLVDGEVVGAIGPGLSALVGVTHGDDEAGARRLAERIWHLRVLADDEGRMERSLADVGGGVLVVSQFTLYGDTSRGRRPGFDRAMPPAEAERLYDDVVTLARARHAPVETGRFGADMRVLVDNDGPVTLLIETSNS